MQEIFHALLISKRFDLDPNHNCWFCLGLCHFGGSVSEGLIWELRAFFLANSCAKPHSNPDPLSPALVFCLALKNVCRTHGGR